jgi:hypothetical protein
MMRTNTSSFLHTDKQHPSSLLSLPHIYMQNPRLQG